MIVVERAISLTQPWATLMASGAKRIETRSWRTSYRGWIAIHAAKGFPARCKSLCWSEPFASALVQAGINDLMDMPLGHVLAVVSLDSCWRTELLGNVAGNERAFGDYSAGRYGFTCSVVFRLRKPIPMKGALGIWRMDRVLKYEDLA